MVRWEYRVEHISGEQIANQLNFLGEEGWELVQMIPVQGEYPYLAVFKRPRGRPGRGVE